ncbi:dihydrofolate reductase [Herbidospora sp. NEAU-GS84]|uniref:Dihydrofolate reductase n=1 Tax=Herbidospora solisilvae TaxID=2696284 RepID=A0A7C9J0Y1_9ACTN|nr:dihydrofolate reductase family protein [Herbidospora solisilvae]NAS21165.1 dihydrofolate reductase [Herbidospora solisilvae]
MGEIVVTESVTLDGVMQAPGRADEDTRDGFRHGGWAAPYADPVMMRVMGAGMAATGAILFGRRTYEDFFAVWHGRADGNPFTAKLDATPKYVVSRTMGRPPAWPNSILLEGEGVPAVEALKKEIDHDVVVLGSGELVRALLAHGLVDRLVLSVHPLVLGSGRRLFPADGPPAAFRLVESVPTGTGVVIATYEVE